MSLWSRAVFLSVALVAGAVAAAAQTRVIPKGWFLHDDLAPTLDLAFYEPTYVSFSVSCTKGYTDTVVAFYPETKGPDGKTPVKLVLSRGATSVAIDANGQMYRGRYVIDGLTSMTPALADLLEGGFTLSTDGKEAKTYATTDENRAPVQKLTRACRS